MLEKRVHKFDPMEFATLAVDEAHFSVTKTFRRAIDYFLQGNLACRLIGVTATPNRHDGKALGQVYDSVAYEYSLTDAIEDGWLIFPDREHVTCDLDISVLKKRTRGDFTDKEIAEWIPTEKEIRKIINPTFEIVGDRTTLIFAPRVAQAKLMAEVLNEMRPGCAVAMSQETPKDERKHHLRRFKDKELQFVCNVGLFSYGMDCPQIEAIVLARPTRSLPLLMQQIGRGTRPLPGVVDRLAHASPAARKLSIASSEKPRLMVLDFIDARALKGVKGVVDALAGSYTDEETARAKQIMRESDDEEMAKDARKALEEARRQLEEENVRKRSLLRGAMAVEAHYKRYRKTLFGAEAVTPKRKRVPHPIGPTPGQRDYLVNKWDYPLDWVLSMSPKQAGAIIGGLKKKCTPAMVRCIVRSGRSEAEAKAMSFEEGRQYIGNLEANAWKRPA
jgi:superfamily II DNA or RNA helicase